MRDLRALPKAHLHLHLELAMRPATLADLCASHGIPVPPIRGFHDFAGFGEIVGGALEAMRAAEDFERLVDEVVEDQARDGVTYVEPAFWPYRYAHLFAGPDAVWEIVLAAGAAAAERHGVVVRWIAAIDRVHDSPEQAMKVVELARRYRDQGIVAVGLHNDENGYPPEPFAPAFRAALDAGLRSTPHAGELDGPASVWSALDALGAHRLQHGIRALEDPALVDELVRRGTCLDVCPTSNVALSVVPSMAEHPLPALLAAGVRCSINADDPLVFGPGCLEEYELCRRELGLTDQQLAACARSSIDCSAAPDDVRAPSLAGIDAWLVDSTENSNSRQ